MADENPWRAEFYRDSSFGDCVRFSRPGDAFQPRFIVTNAHRMAFPSEWNSYLEGRDG